MSGEEDDDSCRRAAEYEALQAIYDDQLTGPCEGPWRITLDPGSRASLEVHLPLDYPSRAAPTPLIDMPKLGEARQSVLANELMELYNEAEVVYEWVEHLRAALDLSSLDAGSEEVCDPSSPQCSERPPDEVHAAGEGDGSGFTFAPSTSRYGQRVRHFDAEVDDPSFAVPITSGASFHPPKSGPSEEFQAHVARVHSMQQVHWALAALLRDKRVARATHNMLAYRFVDDRGVLVADNDDDGESSSGAKLASLLELTGAQNVLLVVSRWFGGVLLGPARFKYIASTGRAMLEEAGFLDQDGGGRGRAGAGKALSSKAAGGASSKRGK